MLLCKLYFIGNVADMTSIIRSIEYYTKGGNKFYIGICSGADREKAMKRRMDDFKKENNLNKMVTLYEANNQQTVREVEENLVQHYQQSEKANSCINRTGGGAGRPSKGPKYQVYLAIEE